MKILVFSDTHGKTEKMHDIISRNRSYTDLVIHLGDCCRDLEYVRSDFPQIAFLAVRGNCDFYTPDNTPQSRSITLEGRTFYLTHGHMQAIKTHGYSLLTAEAKRQGADIVLYGHTHIGEQKEINGITFFNPGSLERPRDVSGGSYGIINVKDGKADFQIINCDI